MRSLILTKGTQTSFPGSRSNPKVDEIIESAIWNANWLQEINCSEQKHEQLRLPTWSTVYRRVKAFTERCNEMNPLGSGQNVQQSAIWKARKTVDRERRSIRDRDEEAREVLTLLGQYVKCEEVPLDILKGDPD
jgi:hypothetical protein